MLFNGTIDNPIGDTEILNTGGSILAATTRGLGSLIRSNILHITATAGNIGSAATPYLNLDLVQWDGHVLVFTANAGGDINIDVLTSARDIAIIYPPVATIVKAARAQALTGTQGRTRSRSPRRQASQGTARSPPAASQATARTRARPRPRLPASRAAPGSRPTTPR